MSVNGGKRRVNRAVLGEILTPSGVRVRAYFDRETGEILFRRYRGKGAFLRVSLADVWAALAVGWLPGMGPVVHGPTSKK